MSEPAWIPIGPAALLDVGPEVAYGENTSPVTVAATTEAGATTVVTAPAFTADGNSQYLVEFGTVGVVPPTPSASYMMLALFLDGVAIGALAFTQTPAGANAMSIPQRITRRLTPAAGSRVFSVRAYVNAGSGSVFGGTGGAGQNMPTFLRVTKVPSAVAGPLGLVPPAALGTVLPASPVDGQVFTLVDSLTAPTYAWRFQYLAAKATNRWLFIGGAPLVKTNDPNGAISGRTQIASTGYYYDPLTAFAAPVAGDYSVLGIMGFEPKTNQNILTLSVFAGTGAPAQGFQDAAVNTTAPWEQVAQGLLSGVAVGATMGVAASSPGAATQFMRRNTVQYVPVAIGG
jgi:hypothetical protein